MFICNLSLHRNQRDFQENLPMVTLNGSAQLSFSAGNETMNERLQSEPFVQREGLYAALCPQSMMIIIHKMKRKLLIRIQILFSIYLPISLVKRHIFASQRDHIWKQALRYNTTSLNF